VGLRARLGLAYERPMRMAKQMPSRKPSSHPMLTTVPTTSMSTPATVAAT
jgi:hypothetical protein